MIQYSDPVSALPGIGPKRAQLFEKLGIHTIYELLTFFPRAYEDRTVMCNIIDLRDGVPSCFEAMVIKAPYTRLVRKGMEVTHVTVADSTGRLQLTFFNQKYSAGKLAYGESYLFYGSLNSESNGYGMTNPAFEPVEEAGSATNCILPIYPLTAGLSNKIIQKAILTAMDACLSQLPEVLPPSVRAARGLCDTYSSYKKIHAPACKEDIPEARRRLVFEEFFLFSCGLALSRERRSACARPAYTATDLSVFYAALPFSLTGAQERAIRDIVNDCGKGRPMSRLVQGDVGSGKTMVAAAAILLALKNGEQAALMVPTELLAKQHYQSLSRLFEGLGYRTGLLTGSLSASERRTLFSALEDGSCSLVIGTHALFSENVKYRNLGMVIADEQHRFGVAQRDSLLQKGTRPHLLVMSATPIPRTLALILYGDLDVSILDEKPAGRKEVQTYLVGESMRARINAFIRKQVSEGHRAFIVCPAVEDNEENSVKSVETWAKTLQEVLFPDLRVELIHGQMKTADKDAAMLRFANGEAHILVATTVIEVGVDVPSATLMVIEDADRFGLSQLHQLRGRVGRGEAQSYCILFSGSKNPETKKRLQALCASPDGFKIAESDLEMRGPGDFFGSRQSGLPAFRTANLSLDLTVLSEARDCAVAYLADPQPYPGSELLKLRIDALFANTGETLN